MTRLNWDAVGERVYETGVDRGVLFPPNPASGVYDNGVVWNGLTTVTEKPTGAASNPQYADNIKYLNLTSAEDFGATVEAITYPKEFDQFDGRVSASPGVIIGQQPRKQFGLSYRSKVGNDVSGQDYGYKHHLVYGAQATPSDRAYASVSDSPAPLAFSWDLTTTPVPVTGQRPTAIMTVDSTKVSAAGLVALENALWGTAGTNPRLPLPDEVIAMFAGLLTALAQPTAPTYSNATKVVTITPVTGVVWYVNGVVNTTGTYTIPTGQYAVVKAVPAAGYTWPTTPVQDTWVFGPA